MISVCIATYNGEKFIKQQILSILTQLSEKDEIVISDDYSTDNTYSIIKDINDERIKFFYNTRERGYTRNFENAIKKSSGEFIFLSDQDDIWIDNKVQIMLDYLKMFDLVVSDATWVDENLKITRGSHFRLSNMRTGFFRHLLKPCYIGACMAFNRKILDKAMPFPRNTALCAHDYWLSIIGEFFYKVGLVNQELILFRRHGANNSPSGEKSPNSLYKKVLIRIYSISQILMRILK
jgi:glycosyltransferase involved in cell wall biosynthesis